jgi:hypothetical protein
MSRLEDERAPANGVMSRLEDERAPANGVMSRLEDPERTHRDVRSGRVGDWESESARESEPSLEQLLRLLATVRTYLD